MRSTTVKYNGREWCHQQLHGLLKKLLDDNATVSLWKSPDGTIGAVVDPDDVIAGYGKGSTLWLALVAAVEQLNERTDGE